MELNIVNNDCNNLIINTTTDLQDNKVIFDANAQCCDITNNIIKEETMETISIDDFKANTKEWLIDKLESMSKDNALQAICNIHDKLHKQKYPKTYIECAKILDCFSASYIDGYKNELLEKLQELLICRNAYWKIAGEAMGLGKPFEPCHTQKRYIIRRAGDKIVKGFNISCVLEFPTTEMRDAFYENFKDLIEQCKELL